MAREFTVRLRHDGGTVTLVVHGHGEARSAVLAVLDAEKAPMRAVVWVRVRPTCEYCTRPATWYVKDSGDGTPLCPVCALDHYGTARGVRKQTGVLGVSRLVPVDASEWR